MRNYSLSDEPGEDRYRITVKKEIDGAASSYLHDKVTVGDVLEVGVPDHQDPSGPIRKYLDASGPNKIHQR